MQRKNFQNPNPYFPSALRIPKQHLGYKIRLLQGRHLTI